MTPRILVWAIAACLSPLTATASEGVISFGGNLATATCTISGPSSFTVTLPTVPVSSLARAWDTAGHTTFSISVTNCSAGLTGANVYFENGPHVVPVYSYLKNNGTAGNVELFLGSTRSGDQVLFDYLLSGQPNPYIYYTHNLTANAGRMDFVVFYIARDVVTPGTVESSVTYSMVYN